MSRTRKVSCLARIDAASVELLTAALALAGSPLPLLVKNLSVTEIGHVGPSLLLVDVDHLDVDPIELLRRLRFVLPACMIAVYTSIHEQGWPLACHLAGANCVLSKDSPQRDIAAGLVHALRSGCFTDPSFYAA